MWKTYKNPNKVKITLYNPTPEFRYVFLSKYGL